MAHEPNWTKIRQAEEAIEDAGAMVMLMLTLGDVETVRPDLTEDEAMDLLRRVYRKEEWEWRDALRDHAEFMFGEAPAGEDE